MRGSPSVLDIRVEDSAVPTFWPPVIWRFQVQGRILDVQERRSVICKMARFDMRLYVSS